MKNTTYKLNAISVLAAVITSLSIASCGGGGSSAPLPGPGNGNGLTPGTADLNGQIVQGGGARVSSAAGDALPGLLVSLISTSTGRLLGTDSTDAGGHYEFKGVPSGDSYLVKVEFRSSQDLDGNGSPDDIELSFPVNPADQAVLELLQQIGVSDSDGDGQLDAIEVELHSSDDSGHSSQSHSQHRRRGGETRVDSNGDGSFDDSFDDSDGNGLPDTSFTDGVIDDSQGGLHELELKGLIESIDALSISVGGQSFALSSSTVWRIGDNRNADPALFTAGMFVEVEGLSDGQSGWIASKVKTEDAFIGTGGSGGGGIEDSGIDELEFRGAIESIDAGSISVNGQSFVITADTEWRIGDNRSADPAGFSVGMFVEVTGDLAGDVWNARRVKLEDTASGGSSVDDNGGGSGTDDTAGDDNGGGSGTDDAAGDDNGGGSGTDGAAGDDNGGDDLTDDNGGGSDDSGSDDNGGDTSDDNSGKGKGGGGNN